MQQLALALAHPKDHFDQLHPDPSGTTIVWNKLADEGKRWVKIDPTTDLMNTFSGLSGEADIFISIAEFYGWRRVSQLKRLCAVYVDVDGNEDIDGLLDTLVEKKMPAPTFLVKSGRGLHAYWLLEPTHSKALPVWQSVQNELVNSLVDIGADLRAKDCARVLRVIGSVNSKSGKTVEALEVTGQRWDLHSLANEVLGYRPTPSASIRSINSARAKAGKKPYKKRKQNGHHREYLVMQDILEIAKRHKGKIKSGYRDIMLFHYVRAASWFNDPKTLRDDSAWFAKTYLDVSSDFNEKEVQTSIGSVVDRAEKAAAGETIKWNGVERDPRYHYRRQTLYNDLKGILDLVGCHEAMRAVISDETARERKTEREKQRRRNAGQIPREQYLSAADELRNKVLTLKAQGLKRGQIATEVGVSPRHVSRLLKKGTSPCPYIAPAGIPVGKLAEDVTNEESDASDGLDSSNLKIDSTKYG